MLNATLKMNAISTTKKALRDKALKLLIKSTCDTIYDERLGKNITVKTLCLKK
jgi:hypothetical protein